MKRVILDTNFLLIPANFGVDIFSELRRIIDTKYDLFIVEGTRRELQGLTKKGKGKDKRAAWLGLQLIDKMGVGEIKGENEYVDDFILQIALPGKDFVATQDAELKKLLKKKGVDCIVLRKKKYLNMIKT